MHSHVVLRMDTDGKESCRWFPHAIHQGILLEASQSLKLAKGPGFPEQKGIHRWAGSQKFTNPFNSPILRWEWGRSGVPFKVFPGTHLAGPPGLKPTDGLGVRREKDGRKAVGESRVQEPYLSLVEGIQLEGSQLPRAGQSLWVPRTKKSLALSWNLEIHPNY